MQPAANEGGSNGGNANNRSVAGSSSVESLLLLLANVETMKISDDECQWAMDIRAAAEADEELKPITDYQYIQHAIEAQGNVEEALKKIRGMQHFREEYHIQDTVEEAMELIEGYMQMHKGFVLSIEADYRNGHFVLVYHYKHRNSTTIDMPKDWRIHLGGFYYMCQAVTSHFLAIRTGVVHICECDGMDFGNTDMDHHQRCWDHLWRAYPLRHKEISWLRTPTAGNILISFLKPFMSEQLRSKFRLGCSFEGYDGTLDEMFNVPNREAAEARIMRNLHQFLVMRYTNQELYHLPRNLVAGRAGHDQAEAQRMEE